MVRLPNGFQIENCSPAAGTNAAPEIDGDSARPFGSSGRSLHQVGRAQNGSMSVRVKVFAGRTWQAWVQGSYAGKSAK
jgi:hypothetical protein